MIHGAIIQSGPMNWQIIQQKDGQADIELSGQYRDQDCSARCEVYARVVMEDSGEAVCEWKKCNSLKTNPEEGQWNILLERIPAGGLYRIETCLNQKNENLEWSRRGDMIHHLGVGDLYVIAGQSNSAGYGKDAVQDPPEIGIHVLRNSGKWDLASHPLNESTNAIYINTEGANPGHSPYLNFAKILKKRINYPIGLLQSACGGSPLSRWNPDEDGDLYVNMMDIIRSQGGHIRGILWYQGCSDTSESLSLTYLDRFHRMVHILRADLGIDNLPILTIQLNRCLDVGDEKSDIGWGRVREAQRQASLKISNVFVVPANDCTLSDSIHISSISNMKLGERLAKMALANIYGHDIPCHAPNIKSVYYNKDQLMFVKHYVEENETKRKLIFSAVNRHGK